MNPAQSSLHFVLLDKLGIHSNEDRYRAYSVLTRRPITSSKQLTGPEVTKMLNDLQAYIDFEPEDRRAQVDILTRPAEDPWAKGSAA